VVVINGKEIIDMDKLNFVDDSLDIRMDWHKVLDKFNAKEVSFADITKNEYDVEIPNRLIVNIQRKKDASAVVEVLMNQQLYVFGIDEEEDAFLVSKTMNGYPDEVLLFGVAASEKDAEDNKCSRFIFDGNFYYIHDSNFFTLEELALTLTSTILFDSKGHRWAMFSNGTIENTNNENVDPEYFAHPKVDKHNRVLCPICGNKMYYTD
jgi:hypothetical protein